jgi:hypothetical protein
MPIGGEGSAFFGMVFTTLKESVVFSLQKQIGKLYVFHEEKRAADRAGAGSGSLCGYGFQDGVCQ